MDSLPQPRRSPRGGAARRIHARRPGSACARWGSRPGRRHSPRRWPSWRRARRRAEGRTCCCRTSTGGRTAGRKRKGARVPVGRRAGEPSVPARPSGRALRRVRAPAPPSPVPRARASPGPRARTLARPRVRVRVTMRLPARSRSRAGPPPPTSRHPSGCWCTRRGRLGQRLGVASSCCSPKSAYPSRSALLTSGRAFFEIVTFLSTRLIGTFRHGLHI